MYSTGLVTLSELQNLHGRLDTICMSSKTVYIFEFKIDATAEVALTQIKEKKYADPFLVSGKSIYLVGVNFVTEDKKINEISVEKWENGTFRRLEGLFKAN